MKMSVEAQDHVIGRAEKTTAPIMDQEGEVGFKLPNGSGEYNIALKDEELDFLLGKGFEKILGNHALAGYDAMVDLPGDLPLFVGTRYIKMEQTLTYNHDIHMSVNVVTVSLVNEQHGTLSVVRTTPDGEWSNVGYETQPPLPRLHKTNN